MGKKSSALSSSLTFGFACCLFLLQLGWGGAVCQGLSFFLAFSPIHAYYKQQREREECVKEEEAEG